MTGVWGDELEDGTPLLSYVATIKVAAAAPDEKGNTVETEADVLVFATDLVEATVNAERQYGAERVVHVRSNI